MHGSTGQVTLHDLYNTGTLKVSLRYGSYFTIGKVALS